MMHGQKNIKLGVMCWNQSLSHFFVYKIRVFWTVQLSTLQTFLQWSA